MQNKFLHITECLSFKRFQLKKTKTEQQSVIFRPTASKVTQGSNGRIFENVQGRPSRNKLW